MTQIAAAYQLDEPQLTTWQKSGYVILKNYFQGNALANLQRWTQELAELPETPGKWMKYFERVADGSRQLCRVENFIDYHLGWHRVLHDEQLLDVLATLFGEPAVLFKEKINFKLPGGSGFSPHQDAPAFFMFDQDFHITMMVAIDPSTEQNGCLQLVENGAHKCGILRQKEDGSLAESVVEQLEWRPLECEPGDVVMFDSYLPHFSHPNRSRYSRRAIYATYNARSQGCQRGAYYSDKREKFPPECERDPTKDYTKFGYMYNLANPIN